MRLVIDASVAVAEALRTDGRRLLEHPELKLFASAPVESETAYELRRRVEAILRGRRLPGDAAAVLLTKAERTVEDAVTFLPEPRYADLLADATWRIPRDPSDASTIALALALDCGIWTIDRDFFGCGLPVWSTEVLRRYLDRVSRNRR